MAKYYAVRNGYRMGIFTSWEDCKSAVSGFSGAQYKSFGTLGEAEEYLGVGRKNGLSPRKNTAVAYVDGSYDINTGRFAYGAVIFFNGKELCD